MTLRDYRPEDFTALCEVDRLCFPKGIAYSAAEIKSALNERGIIAIVGTCLNTGAAGGERVAAFVLARRESQDRGHIITIDVLAEARRQGLGSALMDTAHERLRKAGVKQVLLETSVENSAAIAFYKKMGYTAVCRLQGYYLGKIDAYLMAKDLRT